ncbi:MAG: hypothetical protein N4A76_10510 [Firmicutes bacterium]|nr:hypothetical protein [Bacillota bacterium]
MNQADKNTLNFCVEFIKGNFSEHSQVSMCLVWLKQAIDIIEKETDLSSGAFILGGLKEIEAYLTGKDGSSSSRDIISKIEMIESLVASI